MNKDAKSTSESYGIEMICNDLNLDIKGDINYSDLGKLGDNWLRFDGEFVVDEKNGYGTYFFDKN